MNKNPHKNSITHKILSCIGTLYINLSGNTSKITIKNRELVAPYLISKKNGIFAAWHSQLVLTTFNHKNMNICGLVSKSKDGEYLARILNNLGFKTVRGSTSSGASRSLLKLIVYGKKGFSLAITPDGPKGPPHKVQNGVIFLAQKTGMPVIPIGSAASKKIVFNSWDKFQLPLPFARAAIVYDKPFFVSSDDNLDIKAKELENILNSITLQAKEIIS
ncbi:MAG: lysophospholipid acyltransferase family protein [Elusimicrobia bacterium]|nr:lysophospholipid acyltransferase family protein [Elusimicrobiota bacterium]